MTTLCSSTRATPYRQGDHSTHPRYAATDHPAMQEILHQDDARTNGKQQHVDLRERKRASDRESQRQSRARTKAYIAQLEEAVQAFNKRDAAGVSSEQSPSAAQLMQLIEENQQLRAALGRVNRLTKQILGPDQEGSEDSKEAQEDGSVSTDGVGNGKNVTGLQQSIPFSTNSNLLDYSTWPGFLGANITSPHISTASTAPLFTEPITVPLASLNGSQSEASALIPQGIPPSIPGNYFVTLNNHFTQLEKSDPHQIFTGPDVDADIAIRGVLFGWDAAKQTHQFDAVWQGVEMLDRCLFHRCRTPERAAMMHLLRGLIIYKISPAGQPRRQIAGFQKPTHLQRTLEHPSIIDYFYWPDLRDVLVLSSANYASEFSAAWFATNLRMAWTYRVEDMAKFNTSTNLYSFTDEFASAMYDLSSWTSPFGDPSGEVVVDVFKLAGTVKLDSELLA